MNLGIWYTYLFHALPLFDHVSSSKFSPSYPSLTLHNFYLLCDYTLTHPSSLPSCCISSFITSIVYCLLFTVCCHNPRVSLPSPNHHLNHHLNPYPNQNPSEPDPKNFSSLIEFFLLQDSFQSNPIRFELIHFFLIFPSSFLLFFHLFLFSFFSLLSPQHPYLPNVPYLTISTSIQIHNT